MTLFAQSPEDLLGKLMSALFESYGNTGWSDATLHLLRRTASQQALVSGYGDPGAIVQAMYEFFGITPSAEATQALDDHAQAVNAGLAVQSSPADTSSTQNVQTTADPIDL